MRKFIDITKKLVEAFLDEETLVEAIEIPETDYGYWIKPDGEIIVVRLYSHEETLAAVTRKLKEEGKIDQVLHSYAPAWSAGWIRCVFQTNSNESKTFVIHNGGQLITFKAAASIIAIAKDPRIARFDAEIDGYKSFQEAKPFIALVRSRREAPSADQTDL